MKTPKEKIYTNLQSSVGDFAFNKYQIQWQRISQMQQNASILLAIITFSITLLFSIINIQKDSIPILDLIEWNTVLLPGIFSSLIAGLISGLLLFKVIMPKKLKKDLPLPNELYKELLNTLEKNILKEIPEEPNAYFHEIEPPRFIAQRIASHITDSIIEISSVVEENQKNYTKGLLISIFSIILNILIYSLILLGYRPENSVLIIWHGLCYISVTCSVLISIFLGFSFTKKPLG
jgi:hypothetical protein